MHRSTLLTYVVDRVKCFMPAMISKELARSSTFVALNNFINHETKASDSWPLFSSSNLNDANVDTDEKDDPRVYVARISRATGIDWGTDLSFSWVYVRQLEPNGSAALSGLISKGDQLLAINGETCLGAPFNAVTKLLSTISGSEIDLTLFKGSKQDLRELIGDAAETSNITITVQEKGKDNRKISCARGSNLRNVLVDEGINVYQSLTRWTNCKGKQLCGTCIVDVVEGDSDSCTIKSLDERSTLRSNAPSYRLSCVTNVYKDITVKIFPPVGKDQWTR